MIPKYKAFPRGYEFKNFEGQPEGKLIQIKIPAGVTIPLRQGFGNEVTPVVEPGQRVAAGQIIGRDDESVSSPVHSSVNGKIAKIGKIDYLGREVGAITIESDGTGDWQKLQGCSSDWQGLSAEKIGELIYLSGAGASGRAGIPTEFNSSVIAPAEVENVIIQGVGSEVHNLSPDVLLKGEGLSHFIEGLKILKKVMAGARFHLVLNKSQKSLINEVSQLLPTDNLINFFTVTPKYPVDHDEVLTPLLLGGKFPHGYSVANIGVVVLDIQAVLHVYEAVAEGKSLIERTVALCGPGFREKLHVKLRLGSPLEHVIRDNVDADKKLRLVLNSCLTGQRLSDLSLPVDRTFTTVTALLEENESQFLAFARPGFRRDSYSRTCLSSLFKKNSKMFQKTCGTNVHGELRPCIFCTFCEEVCPVSIIPHLLFQHVERDVIDENLLRYKIFDCIECNLCSYVCPSKIPVAEFIKKGKSGLISEGFEIPAPDTALKGLEKYKSVE
ncbi:MAG TPA: 4Fe-4S dicluster domain-containing protein [Phycisphaerales bacterium]|nr:4Fe-4S dicluster domain-containing protein [Phycisphaerales bacterium]